MEKHPFFLNLCEHLRHLWMINSPWHQNKVGRRLWAA